MIKVNYYVVWLWLVLLSFPFAANGKETITWMEAVYPPFLIHEGEFQGQGYGDVGTDILVENLRQYQHKQLTANISRQYEQFKRGEQVCTVGLYKNPDREKFMYFSLPTFYSLPTVLIINKEKHQAFGGEQSVSLQQILRDEKLIIGYTENRSYTADVDALLMKYGNEQNSFAYESRGEMAFNFFEMLKKGRLDAVLGSPEEVLFQAERLGIRDQLMTVAIEENQHDLSAWFSYVACAKTPWGEQAIKDINKVLVEQRPTERYRGAYERWIDTNSLDGFRKAYDELFLSVTE